ncbi:MAG: hypothetical protein ABWZ75_04655 [Novosphingobium sp.]
MAFVSDKELRVLDPDRGFELFRTTGGSDGRIGRKLIAPGGECTFGSYLSFRDANLPERQLRPEISRTGVWRLRNAGPPLLGTTLRETYEILREAVLAERLHHSQDVNWAVVIPTNLGDE